MGNHLTHADLGMLDDDRALDTLADASEAGAEAERANIAQAPYIAHATELATPPAWGRIAGRKGAKRMTASIGTVTVRLPIVGTQDYADLLLYASVQAPGEKPEVSLQTATVAIDLPSNLAFSDVSSLPGDILASAEHALYNAPWFESAVNVGMEAIRKGLAPAGASASAKPAIRRSLASALGQ